MNENLCIVDEVYVKEDIQCPVTLNFLNGYPTDKFGTRQCLQYEDVDTGKRTVVTELNGFLYAGQEKEEDQGNTYIIAQNKSTGKVRIIQVKNVDMKPILKSKKDEDKTDATEISNLELSRKFGSKKHKQIMEQREKLKINVQTVTEQMQNVTVSVTEDQLDLSSYNKTDSDEFYIPTIHRDATKVEDIYDLHEILTPEEYEKIYTEIKDTEYMSDLNPFLKSIATKDQSQKLMVLLVYANTLLQLYVTLMRDIAKKNYIACPYSETLNDVVMKNFLSNINGKRGRSPQYKDKALCHALVFVLLINNYKFNFDDMCQHLKLTPRTVTSKVALTGATLVTAGNKKVAQLKLPLNRPALRRRSTKF